MLCPSSSAEKGEKRSLFFPFSDAAGRGSANDASFRCVSVNKEWMSAPRTFPWEKKRNSRISRGK